MALSDFQTLVNDLVRDDSGFISDAQRDLAIANAVARYSKDRPRRLVEDVASSGSTLLNLPAAWTEISNVISIEYPIGQTPPALLDNDAWDMYSTPSGQKIMLENSVASGNLLRVTFSAEHLVEVSNDTIKLSDRPAVCALAASYLLDQLAAKYAGVSESSIAADGVNFGSKSSEYAARARSLLKRYTDEFGIDTKRNQSASAVVSAKPVNSLGRDRLTHGAAYRNQRRVH